MSPKRCITWEKRVQSAGGSIELTAYEGAQHDFDDPSASRQRNESNAAATRDAVRRSEEFFGRQLKQYSTGTAGAASHKTVARIHRP